MKLSDPATGWSFDCLTDTAGNPLPGGIVLQNVKHDQHNLARDVRVIGFWLTIETVDPPNTIASTASQFHLLDATNFTVSAVRILTPAPVTAPGGGGTFQYLKEADTALYFSGYFKDSGGNSIAYGVASKFDAPNLLSGQTNCEFAGLTVEQIFLFSRYGNSPKHEPSGGLSAARLHPMVRYAFAANGSFDATKRSTRIASIRFDYRLNLVVDRHYDVATNAGLQQLGNQAGLFADSDTALGTVVTSIGSTIWNLSTSAGLSSGSFDAVEKPLVLEVMGPGLAKGFPTFATSTAGGQQINVRCWDNIHWWGARGAGQPIISAPGAFHAAHIHWRWGGAARAARVGGSQTFNPQTWPKGIPMSPAQQGMWGPLVDPGIWMQSIRVAVTKNDARLDPMRGAAPTNLSKSDWKTLFTGLRPVPDDISAGDDLVLWYSTEVHREVTTLPSSAQGSPPFFLPPPAQTFRAATSGTVFIHGLFFAHDAEKTGFTVGSTAPAYAPRSEATIRSGKSWFRAAN
ncbi:MAG TPA: hypothetical protein VH855_05940 [Acetobacteraceae bacterium]